MKIETITAGAIATALSLSACGASMGEFEAGLQGVWSCEVTGEDAISFVSADGWKVGLTGGNSNTVTVDGGKWESVTIPTDPSEPATTIGGTLTVNDSELKLTVDSMSTPYEDPDEYIGRSWSIKGVGKTVAEMAQLNGDHDPVRWAPMPTGFALQEDEDSALVCVEAPA